MRFVTIVMLLTVAALVTMVIQDTDLWTLLAQGRAILADPGVIGVNQWTWPEYGTPQVASSWLFRPLLWPFWSMGGALGVQAWRWISALLVFGLLFAAARRMGARGLVTPFVFVACALVYRTRADARPESAAAILFALAFWILETRRAGGPDRALWLVPVALLWSNLHVSVYLLVALVAFYAIDEWRRGATRGARAAAPVPKGRSLWPIAALSLGASLIHPSGWNALIQPFQFAFQWRGDPMFGTIEELQPLLARPDWRSGTPILAALWPLLLLLRAAGRETSTSRPRGFDGVELLACLAFTAAFWMSLRFAGVWAMAAAPFMARDLTDLLRASAPAAGAARAAPAWGAAFGVAAACVALTVAEAARADRPFGLGIAMRHVPEHAASFMDTHGIRGRGFNHMQHGGYLAHRFWPEKARMPFVTTQPELSSAAVRASYVPALNRPANWYALDQEWRFEYVLLRREQDPGDHLLDVLDLDTDWIMVFGDDAGELYVRRSGPFAAIADSFAYLAVPGGRNGRDRLLDAAAADTVLRARAQAEAQRMADASPMNGGAHRLLGFIAMMDGRKDDAAHHLQRTVVRAPETPRVREALGDLAAERGDPREANRWYRAERDRFGANVRIDAKIMTTR